MVIIDETVDVTIAGVVEDYRPLLAGGGAQGAPAHLQIQAERFCRSQQQNAGQRRHIEAFGEQSNIKDYVDFAIAEPGDRRGAIRLFCAGIDMDRTNTGVTKFGGKFWLCAMVQAYAIAGPWMWFW